MPHSPATEPLLWPREAAPLAGVTPKVLAAWARQGKLTSVPTLGGQRRFPRSELLRLLQAQGHPPEDAERLVAQALAHRSRPASRPKPAREQPPATPAAEPYLSGTELASILHVSHKTVARWVAEGRLSLPVVRTLGGHRRYPRSAVAKLLHRLGYPDPEGTVDAVLHRRRHHRQPPQRP